MINLYDYKGFKLLSNDHSLEANRLSFFCLKYNINLVRVHGKVTLHDYIPCGSVEWCEQLLGYHPKPNYYPEWVESLLHRKVWQGDKWLLQKVFVKPADRYKRFTGFVTTGSYKGKKKPPFWFSEVVKFENEWRCYVTQGKIKACEWYWGDEINTPKLSLEGDIVKAIEIFIPPHYNGALDIGYIKNIGELAIIESQHPFYCGWYGKQEDDHIYFQWLIDGWKYMQELKNENNI